MQFTKFVVEVQFNGYPILLLPFIYGEMDLSLGLNVCFFYYHFSFLGFLRCFLLVLFSATHL